MSDRSPLRQALDAAIDEAAWSGEKLSLTDLTVLYKKNDPFRLDSPARHRDGEWLADAARELGFADRKIHLRGLHYSLIGRSKPDGTPYTNTEKDWLWLVEDAGKAARWLGYIPFDSITDQRNAAPVVRTFKREVPWPFVSVGLDVEIPDAADIEPWVGVAGFTGVQPYRIVLVGEKSSLDDVLGPVASRHDADLFLPTGCLSDTLIHRMAKDAAQDGRPMVVLYFADADPSGWNMPIEVARKLQAFTALGIVDVPTTDAIGNRITRPVDFGALDFQVHRVALTPDQVREYELPSTPLKPTERRADAWQRAMGVQQTEIDALASLRPNLLRDLATDAIAPFYDRTLRARVSQADSEWRQRAQDVVDNTIDQGQMGRLRAQADAKLRELRDEIDAINNALRLDASDFDLPTPVVPEPQVNGEGALPPLLHSEWSFADQCSALREDKAYRRNGVDDHG